MGINGKFCAQLKIVMGINAILWLAYGCLMGMNIISLVLGTNKQSLMITFYCVTVGDCTYVHIFILFIRLSLTLNILVMNRLDITITEPHIPVKLSMLSMLFINEHCIAFN